MSLKIGEKLCRVKERSMGKYNPFKVFLVYERPHLICAILAIKIYVKACLAVIASWKHHNLFPSLA